MSNRADEPTNRKRLDELLALQDELATKQFGAYGKAIELQRETARHWQEVGDLELQMAEVALDVLDLCAEAAREIRAPAALVLYEGATRRPWHRPLVRRIAAACGFPATRENRT